MTSNEKIWGFCKEFGGIVALIAGFVFYITTITGDVTMHDYRIANNERSIASLRESTEQISATLSSFRTDMAVIKKDLEFIKEQLDKRDSKDGK